MSRSRGSRSAAHREALIREYTSLAARYETRWARYIGATVRATADRVDREATGHVLDVGCGTGVLLSLLRERFLGSRLAGVDLVSAMLDVARTRNTGATLYRSNVECLPFAASSFDSVLCSNVFHYFPSPDAALAEMLRVLRPGGRLVLTDWCDDYVACRACDRILRVFNRAHVRTYMASELEAMARAAGFASPTVERYKIDWLWGLMTLRAERPVVR